MYVDSIALASTFLTLTIRKYRRNPIIRYDVKRKRGFASFVNDSTRYSACKNSLDIDIDVARNNNVYEAFSFQLPTERSIILE